MTRREFSFDDLGVLSVALRIACLDRSLTRNNRDRMHRLRLKVDALRWEQAPAEGHKRAQRAQAAEHKSAKTMPPVSRKEADDWHSVLSGKAKRQKTVATRIMKRRRNALRDLAKR